MSDSPGASVAPAIGRRIALWATAAMVTACTVVVGTLTENGWLLLISYFATITVAQAASLLARERLATAHGTDDAEAETPARSRSRWWWLRGWQWHKAFPQDAKKRRYELLIAALLIGSVVFAVSVAVTNSLS